MRVAPRTSSRFAAIAAAVVLVLAAVSLAACGRAGLGRHYEYDEDITLSVDGSAAVVVNASIPALVNLRGMDLDVRPTAMLPSSRPALVPGVVSSSSL